MSIIKGKLELEYAMEIYLHNYYFNFHYESRKNK